MYKSYNISLELSKQEIPEPTFKQDKISNLEKVLWILQSPTKTISFYPLPHYKTIQQNRETDKQY